MLTAYQADYQTLATMRLALVVLLTCSAQAQSLTGRLVDTNSAPIAGATIEMTSGGASATSNNNGDFTITGLSNGTRTAQIDPRMVTVAPAEIDFVINGATNAGTIVMDPGATVSGTVLSPAGAGLFGVNLNAYLPDGTKLFTPHDGTDINGNFQIVVPLVPGLMVEALPPFGTTLLPFQTTLNVTGPVNLGNVTLQQGHTVSGTVIDAVSFLPISNTRIVTYNALTDLEIPQANNTANTFGVFSVVLPTGIHEVEVIPPPTSPHVGRQLFNVTVLGQSQNLGAVALDRAVFLSGSVTGPNGPVANADIDVFSDDGYKLFTPHDKTDLNGAFSIAVEPGSYSLTVQPPFMAKLAGRKTGLFTASTPTNVGTIACSPGVWVGLIVQNSAGQPIDDADIDLLDPITGESQVLIGDHANSLGFIAATEPPGNWTVRVEAPQGSGSAPLIATGLSLPPNLSNFFVSIQLPDKEVITDAGTYGIPTIGQGGSVLANLSLENMLSPTRSVAYEALVRLSDGSELTILPPLVVDLPGHLALGLSGTWVPIPVVPAHELGRKLRLRTRVLDAASGAILDEAQLRFIVQ